MTAGVNDNNDALDQALRLLATVIDDPLVTLPGGHPVDGPGPTEIRLRHFKPDLSEQIAKLLEEQGR